MTCSALRKLIEISSPALGPEITVDMLYLKSNQSSLPIPEPLRRLLLLRNGFLTFGSALCTFPLGADSTTEVCTWNQHGGWKEYYSGILKPDSIVFAFDLFANPYFIDHEGVWKLNAETGQLDPKGTTLEEWAETILKDYSYETGYPLAAEWQKGNHPLGCGSRLLPRKPFVLGGDYVTGNLKEVRSDVAARKLGQLYQEISGLPDGANVDLTGWI